MTHTLLLHDRLAPPKNHDAYVEVLDPRPRDGCIKVFDVALRADRYVELARLKDELYAGKLTLMRVGKPRLSLAAQPDDAALHEKIRLIRAAMRRIHEVQKQLGVSFAAAYRYAAEAYRKEATPLSPPFPTASTAYRYRHRERAGLPVLRGDKNKGNRVPRYPQEVLNTICRLAEQHYLVPHSRWSLKQLTDAVNRQVRGSFLPMDRPSISTKFVKHTILRLASVDPEYDRMLPTQVVAGKAIAKQRLRVELPFERVEQDALHLPFVATTSDGVSSQLYLVHAIDCSTSYPLGWRLVVGAPTDADSLDCVELYMAPLKAKRFKALGIDHDMNVCGTPGLLVFDNGPENKGERIKNLERLGVDVKHCRARAGQEKPFIERLNRSLKEALEGLSGCTRLDGRDGQRDPVALGDELMSVDELERWIVRWLYEKWIHTPLERLNWDVVLTGSVEGNTPAARWRHFEASCLAVSLPPSRAEWLAALYEHRQCRLSSKTGITLDTLHYKGDALPGLIHRYGDSREVRVLFNPDDFRYVYVYEGDELPLVTLLHEHLRPDTPAWSFREAKERLKGQKSKSATAPEAQKFADDLHATVVAHSLAPKRKKPSAYERNRQTAQREKHKRAVIRASEQPRPLPPPTVPSRSREKAPDAVPAAVTTAAPLLDDVPLLPVLARESGDLL